MQPKKSGFALALLVVIPLFWLSFRSVAEESASWVADNRPGVLFSSWLQGSSASLIRIPSASLAETTGCMPLSSSRGHAIPSAGSFHTMHRSPAG